MLIASSEGEVKHGRAVLDIAVFPDENAKRESELMLRFAILPAGRATANDGQLSVAVRINDLALPL